MPSEFNRRHFVKLGALATAGATLKVQAAETSAPAAPALPKLPYAFDALEPHIDALTMEIHYGKHHAAYVTKLKEAFEKQPALAAKPLHQLLEELPSVSDEAIRSAVRNNGGGHWNHSFFWETLTPAAQSGAPSSALAEAINQNFGSMDAFKKAFTEASTKRFGSGWAWLIVKDGKLKVVSTPNQDNPLMAGLVPESDLGKPLLGLDVWEHAYYLRYQNRRPDYIGAWWNIVNWTAVNERFAKA
jgi:superoxide dismutase, Fe-Mn family